MYRLLFEDGTFIDVPGGFKSMAIGLANYDGKNPPKYLYLWFKHRYVDRSVTKDWENSLWHKKLIKIFTYDEDKVKIRSAISVPEPFIELHYEEGDLVVTYGDQLYSDEAH